jgi:hypothetical protein
MFLYQTISRRPKIRPFDGVGKGMRGAAHASGDDGEGGNDDNDNKKEE